MGRPQKRLYLPKNPEKYNGDHTNVVMRSSWETKFAIWCDANPNVLNWGSETIVIPYICGTDNRPHRYYVDFVITVKNQRGEIKKYIVEIKPYKETMPPKEPKRKTQNYRDAILTFIKNRSKWEAATIYAKQRGMEFIILTEKELFHAKQV
jgi:hypothetical protein